MDIKELEKFVLSIKKMPCKLSNLEGRSLKQFFSLIPHENTLEKNVKSLRFRYEMELNKEKYLLLEEYLFREKETHLDLNRAIAINYYLNKFQDIS